MNLWLVRIKPLFDEKGMKPKDIAAAIGCSVRDVYHWNKDGYQTFDKYFYPISAFLDVSVDYLKGETDEKKPPPKSEDGLTEDEKEIIRLFRSASPATRGAMLHLLRSAEAAQSVPGDGEAK